MKYEIPEEIRDIVSSLLEADFEAYPVGGCVRDIVLKKNPKDWDVTTSAKPEEIREIFPDSVYENEFGTVAVKTESDDNTLKIVEVTTFRIESKYSDKRHPDEIRFAEKLKDDLGRRDFTINAVALDTEKNDLIDPFDGVGDMKKGLIQTVGNPEERFSEDPLRLLRAARLAAELGFEIEEETEEAIRGKAGFLENIARERSRDEFVKIIMAGKADEGIVLLESLGLLKYIIPELCEGIGCDQAKHHVYTVWEHAVRSLKYAAENDYSLEVRLAALLHDVGKPRTKEGEGEEATFYNHEIVGAKMTKEIMKRLRFSKDLSENVVHLVRYHLFYYNVGEVTEAGVRRFLRRVGLEHIDDLMKLREADRIGSGVPKAVPYKNRHLLFMVDKVRRDPISTNMLEVDGGRVMEITGLEPGPKIGWILKALMEDVLEDPKRNKKEYLEKRIRTLAELSDKELEKKAEAGENKVEEFEKGVIQELKKKHQVK